MRNLRSTLAAIILLFFLLSCTNIQQLTTYWEPDMKGQFVKPTGFDATTKVGWTSYNDSTHLFFSVDLLSPITQMSVLNRGLTIYIDTTGKLKESTSVCYPIIKRMPGAVRPESNRKSDVEEQQSPVLRLLENSERMDLRWTQGGQSHLVNPSLDETEFTTLISLDSLNYVSLLIGVPLSLIHPSGIDGLNELSIGFGVPMAMGRAGMARPGGGQASMNTGGGGRSGSGGGGRGGGGGGGNRGGGSGGQMGGRAPMGGSASAGPTLEKFWYKTVIRKTVTQ